MIQVEFVLLQGYGVLNGNQYLEFAQQFGCVAVIDAMQFEQAELLMHAHVFNAPDLGIASLEVRGQVDLRQVADSFRIVRQQAHPQFATQSVRPQNVPEQEKGWSGPSLRAGFS